MSRKPQPARTPEEQEAAERDAAERVARANAARGPVAPADGFDPDAVDPGDGSPGGEPPAVNDDDPDPGVVNSAEPPRAGDHEPPVGDAPALREQAASKAAQRTAVEQQVFAIVRQVYGSFVRLGLADARHSGGSYAPKSSSALAGSYDVPDGTYRIDGYDWRLTFRRKRLVLVEASRPEQSGAGVIRVPSQ